MSTEVAISSEYLNNEALRAAPRPHELQLDQHPVVMVPISSLRPCDSPRLAGEDSEHARLLAGSAAALPPIVVHRQTMRVIDGMHRVRAAVLRGRDEIGARFYDGDDEDAFVLAVRVNVAHGLPLSLADRTAAAARIVDSRPQWSDRMIASATGLAGTTVGTIRRCSTDQVRQSNIRVGRDGRARPVNGAAGRLLASELITDYPNASLREIAKAAGVAPSTVRDVRERMRSGDDPVPPRQRGANTVKQREKPGKPRSRPADKTTGRTPGTDRASTLQRLRTDPSLRFTEGGRTLLRWLDQLTTETTALERVADQVPIRWAGTVAELIRGNIVQVWAEFAEQLERRAKSAGRSSNL